MMSVIEQEHEKAEKDNNTIEEEMTDDAVIEQEHEKAEKDNNTIEEDIRVFKFKNGEHFVSMVIGETDIHFECLHPLVFTGVSNESKIQLAEWIWESGDKAINIPYADLLVSPLTVHKSMAIAYLHYIDRYYDLDGEAPVKGPTDTLH